MISTGHSKHVKQGFGKKKTERSRLHRKHGEKKV